jgi:hypothetical protein
MKYPTLQKITLIAVAAATALAFSAQARQPTFATAKETKTTKATSPQRASGATGAHILRVPAAPAFPEAILYDQYNNNGANATSSQDFEAAFDPFDDFNADDFNVPADQSWSVESIDADGVYFNGTGPALSFNVFFYNDAGGLPGSLVASRTGMSYTTSGTTFSVTVSPAVALAGGHYWVSVQARMDFGAGGQWGWTDRAVQSNSEAAWENPGGGFGVCTSWGARGNTCGIDPGVPDQVFRINGTLTNGTPTPTPSMTPTPTPGGILWYNGDFDGESTGNGLANEDNTSLGSGQYSHIYDDFNVPAGGWDVGAVFSNNLENTNVTAATFEIRQGVSSGNGGTIVASGMTVTPDVFPTGRTGFGFVEMTVQVSNLNIHLNQGTYHLNVTPVGDLTGRSFNSSTMGANCVGTPCGNNGNSFWDSNFFGVNFTPAGPNCAPPNLCNDFSMGILSTGGGGGNITLQGKARQRVGPNKVLLKWSPADGGQINVLRDGVVVQTTADDGKTIDILGHMTGTFSYQVCETDSGDCSNTIQVTLQ